MISIASEKDTSIPNEEIRNAGEFAGDLMINTIVNIIKKSIKTNGYSWDFNDKIILIINFDRNLTEILTIWLNYSISALFQ